MQHIAIDENRINVANLTRVDQSRSHPRQPKNEMNAVTGLPPLRHGQDDFILQTEVLRKQFGSFVAVNGVSLKVRRGTIHSIIGPNGAGKTTLFNLLTKFIAPSSGRILFDAQDITHAQPARIACMNIVRSFQISAIFPALSVLENVRIGLLRQHGLMWAFWRSRRVLNQLDRRAREILDIVGLGNELQTLAGQLSYGKKRALELATTAVLEPQLLLLDEPAAGMGQEDVAHVTDLIRRLSAGRTILMVEHNLSIVAELSDYVTVLARGEVLAEGDYCAVSSDPRVAEAYLGSVDE